MGSSPTLVNIFLHEFLIFVASGAPVLPYIAAGLSQLQIQQLLSPRKLWEGQWGQSFNFLGANSGPLKSCAGAWRLCGA